MVLMALTVFVVVFVVALDLLAHAYGGLGNWERTGFYGHQALVLKDKAIPDLQHEIIPASAPKDGPSTPPPLPAMN